MKISHKLAVHCAALLICSSAFGADTYLEGGSLQTVTDNWILPQGSDLFIGGETSSNRLEISGGIQVENGAGYVGYSGGSDNNSVLVSGNGSIWQNSEEIYIGGNIYKAGGSGNWVNVADGGTVSTESLKIYAGNQFNLNNGGKLAVSTNFNAAMAGFNWNEGGALEVGGTVTGAGSVIDGGRSLILNGPQAVWNEFDGIIGQDDSGNGLVIENGGSVTLNAVALGFGDSSHENYVTVRGAGSTLLCDSGAALAYLSGPAPVPPDDRPEKGSLPFPEYMKMLAENPFYWEGGGLYVGRWGSGNRLNVLDGASVSSWTAALGVRSTSSNNVVYVSGINALLQAQESLTLGGYYSGTNWIDGGTGNSLSVDDGAWVLVGDMNTNSLSGLRPGIVVGDVSGSALFRADNGSVIDADRLFVGVGTNESGRVEIAGEHTVWNGSAIAVGGLYGSGNEMVISEGAQVYDLYGNVGSYSDLSESNSVTVTGAGSAWHNDALLYVGFGGKGNRLNVLDGGHVTVGGFFLNHNESTITIDPTSQIIVGTNYYQDATSTLWFNVKTNAWGTPVAGLLSVGNIARFEAGAAINYASNVGELKLDQTYTNKLVAAGTLIIGGVTNAQTSDLEMLDASGSLVDVEFWANDQDIYALAGRKKLAESAGLTAGTMLANVATEVDRMSQSGNPGAQNLINIFNTLSGSAQSAQLKQQFAQAAPTPMHSQGLGGGLGEVKQHMRFAGPQGPGGPFSGEADGQAWMKTYGSWADHEASGAAAGYDQSIYGTVVGMDWIRGDLLMGFGGGYSYSTLSQNAGQSRANTGYGVGYVSLSQDAWFGDMALAVGGGSVKDTANSAFAFQGDYDAGNGSLYLGGGREMELLDGLLILTPEASMQLGYYYQDSHLETSLSGLSRNVDSYDQFSAQSSVGATLALQKEVDGIIWQPELRVRWLHEFENDADPLSYTLVGGLGSQYSAALNAPEENVFETGLGLSCTLTNDLSLQFDVDWRRGDDYDAYTGSGRFIYRF
ncbi:MAG: autotransporter domain-containing protein [Pontiellaceae bacterium]|nr:autotransporter domain-containing protein [Pontiellaceae bacterium]